MIIVNGRFLLRRVTGVERYAREILAELDKLIRPGEIEIAVPPETENIPNYKNINAVKIGKLHNHLWEHISFPIYVKKHRGISLNLCNAAPLVSPGIVCIHDVKVKAHPQNFSKKFIFWHNILLLNSCKRAKKIITVSNFSKKEICRYYGVVPEKITIAPDSWQHFNRIEYDENTLEKYGLKKEKYMFSMSSLEPNKNFKWIAELARKNTNRVFAVAGSLNKKVFAEGINFECPNNMKFLGYVTDEEAKTLMRDCEAFLFPTFYEGFGIPPLEAMSAGCNCIVVSDTEVMHEIFGEVVNYINPCITDVDLNALIKVKNVNSILHKYSWKESANILLRTISDYLGSSF